MPTRSVPLSESDAALVDRLVAADRYDDAAEVVHEALRLVAEREAMTDARRLEALRAAAKVGLDQLDAGDSITFRSPGELAAFFAGLVPAEDDTTSDAAA